MVKIKLSCIITMGKKQLECHGKNGKNFQVYVDNTRVHYNCVVTITCQLWNK